MHRVHSPFVYQEQSVCEIIVNNRKTAHSYFEDCQAQQITLCVWSLEQANWFVVSLTTKKMVLFVRFKDNRHNLHLLYSSLLVFDSRSVENTRSIRKLGKIAVSNLVYKVSGAESPLEPGEHRTRISTMPVCSSNQNIRLVILSDFPTVKKNTTLISVSFGCRPAPWTVNSYPFPPAQRSQ